MAHQYRMIDVNTYDMETVNEYKLVDHNLPDKWQANAGGPIIGGSDVKKISRASKKRIITRSGGLG